MSNSDIAPNLGDVVRVALTKSDEAEAMIETLSDRADVTLRDMGAYWLIEANGEVVFEPDAVGDILGREMVVEDLLVPFATYAGRVEASGDVLRITSAFPQMGTDKDAERELSG